MSQCLFYPLARFKPGTPPDDARTVLNKSLGANAADKRLHFALAKLLMKSPDTKTEELLYHFKRSFTDGDSNYDAQLLYARQLLLDGSTDSRRAFATLAAVRMSPQVKNRLLYPIADQRFSGSVFRLESSHAFVTRNELGDTIFMHESNVQMGLWKQLTNGHRINFAIAFSFRGPSAT